MLLQHKKELQDENTQFIKLLFLCLFAVSCRGNSQAELDTTILDAQGESGFVGTVDGTDAFIALVIGANEAIVYVCNGDEEIYEWFR